MSKFGIVNLIDKLFITMGIFLVVFAWINFYFHSLWSSFIFSILISFAIVYLLYFILGRKSKKFALSKAENIEMNKLFFTFRLNPKEERLKLIRQIIIKEICDNLPICNKNDFETVVEQKPTMQDDLINDNENTQNLKKSYQKVQNKAQSTSQDENFLKKSVNLKDGLLTYTFMNRKHLVVLATQFEVLTQNDLINVIDEFLSVNFDEIDIICAEVGVVDAEIFTDKKINFIDKNQLYALFKKHNIFPKSEKIKMGNNKPKIINVIKTMFAPSKARGYFLCGLIIILSSIILPYHIYYLVFGSVLMLFGIACKLMKYENFIKT